MPSGNEIGADELLWIPGGKTLGGFSEAIIEPIKVKNTNIYTTQIIALEMMKAAGELESLDVDIFPRDPEWFSNRALDALIGFVLIVVLTIASILCSRYME